VRATSAGLVDALCVRDPSFARRIGLLPAVEAVNAFGALLALFQTTVTWRERRYRVARDGTVAAVHS
jgi:hypothetical protein